MRRGAVTAGLLFAAGAHAATLRVDFDPAATKITWVLVGNVHTVHGTFGLKEGHIALDTVTGVVSGALIAEAESGQSGNESRDRRMKRDVLESGRFPEIKLEPAKVEGTVSLSGSSAVRVTGTLLVHGGTHQVSLPVEVAISGTTVTGRGKFSVPYVEWGMKDPSNFLFKVDKVVEIEVAAAGHIIGGNR